MKKDKDLTYSHPEIHTAEKIHREAEMEALKDAGLDDFSLGKGLANSGQPTGHIAWSPLDPFKSVDHRTGLPGGKESLPRVDPESKDRQANHDIWLARMESTKLKVQKRTI